MQGSNEGCGWCFLSQSHVIMCWRWVTTGGVYPGDTEDCLCRLEPWVCLFVCLSRLGGSSLSSDRATITQCGITGYGGERAPDKHGMLRYPRSVPHSRAAMSVILGNSLTSGHVERAFGSSRKRESACSALYKWPSLAVRRPAFLIPLTP
jgi:hypothetical protein